MTVFLAIIVTILLVLLVVVAAIHPVSTAMSVFELRRRKEAGDKRAADELHHRETAAQLDVVLPVMQAILMVGIAALLIFILDWYKGISVALLIALLHVRVARAKPVRTLAGRYRKWLLRTVDTYEAVFRVIGGRVGLSSERRQINSHEELAHMLEASPIFSSEDRKLLESVLRFSDQTVADIMTTMQSVVTVRPDELLGPLVLDDLHKTKHEIFPVENKGDIVGLLDIRDHVALKRQESVYARDVMHSGVIRISQSEPLDEALRALVAAKQPYLIVINDDQQPVGIIGLGDTIRALTGWTRR